MTDLNDHFQIVLANTISPPSESHNLLVAFRFGQDSDDVQHPAIVDVYLDPVEHKCLYECWWIAAPVTYRNEGQLRIAECEDYAIVVQDNVETPGDDLESITHLAYLDLISAVRSTDHQQIAKVWNYIGGINDGDGDLERYRRFSVGRATAFAEMKLIDDAAPTGTGVGTRRDLGLTLIALASKHPLEFAENPRQISAFHYPRQYGPSSPKFARGGSVTNTKHGLYLLSGTAAIVGHESVHPYNVESQVEETLKNLTELDKSVSILDTSSVLRVYLRNPDDISAVEGKIEAELGLQRSQLAYLQGNICRRELLIEIDGVRVQ